jgi:hypothetical protein
MADNQEDSKITQSAGDIDAPKTAEFSEQELMQAGQLLRLAKTVRIDTIRQNKIVSERSNEAKKRFYSGQIDSVRCDASYVDKLVHQCIEENMIESSLPELMDWLQLKTGQPLIMPENKVSSYREITDLVGRDKNIAPFDYQEYMYAENAHRETLPDPYSIFVRI